MDNVYYVEYRGSHVTYMTKAKNFEQARKKAISYANKRRKKDGWSKKDTQITRLNLVGDLDF